jgi:DNA segregation ATPase FtsK/SpoIIIE, S-DNA-T family
MAIGLCLVGILLALGLYKPGSAGGVGAFLVHFIRFWAGHVVYVAPLLLFGAGLALALDFRRATDGQMVAGVTGLLVTLFGWVHLMTTRHGVVFDTTGARFFAMLGWNHDPKLLKAPDGGFFGAVIMSALFPLGDIGSYFTLAAVGLASMLLISELTLRGILERLHERSRIAAEQARSRALAVRQRCRDAGSNLPALPAVPSAPTRHGGDLFLDVGTGSTRREKGEETGTRSRGLRRLLGGMRNQLGEPVDEAIEPAVPSESAIVPTATSEGGRGSGAGGQGEEGSGTQRVPGVRGSGETGSPNPQSARSRQRPQRPAASLNAPSGEFVLPPLEILDAPAARPKRNAGETDANIAILENTLAQFRIEAQVVEIADGPSITRYEIRLGEGIRVKKILDLADNIAMSLSAMSVRVEAPIPGKAAIGIEVPKKQAAVVTLRECLESNEFKDFSSKVSFVLGKDVAGNVRCADLARMPHLLVAGATNSGKSVCLNVLIASMLFRSRPDELKMIMIDPKRVELTLYEGIPHLVHPVVKDVKQAAGILRWVLKEMDRRYDLFAHVMTRNIEGYNEKMAKEPEKKLPFLVVVIDELADLMMQQGPEIEQAICRLAQLARATGIHLVIATQRPSVDVITGLIKANVPSRIAFSVSSQIDSRTIIDSKGAENLIGRGDMLFKPVDANKPVRIQGAFLRESEVEVLVNHLKAQGRPDYIAEPISVDHGSYGLESQEEAEDELFEPAARFVVTTGHASTSMIQRKFKIGYTRAARLVDMMESRGIVGALDGAKPREILMSRDGLDQMFLQTRDSLFRGQDYAGEDEPEGAEGPEEIEEIEETGGTDPFVED